MQQACIGLGVSQSGYYAWKDRPDAPRTLRRIWLAGEIADVHKEPGGTYGALRVTAELKLGRGISVGHNAVGHIMRQLGLVTTDIDPRTPGSPPQLPRPVDLVVGLPELDEPGD